MAINLMKGRKKNNSRSIVLVLHAPSFCQCCEWITFCTRFSRTDGVNVCTPIPENPSLRNIPVEIFVYYNEEKKLCEYCHRFCTHVNETVHF